MYKHDGRRRSLIEFVTNTDIQNRADQEHSGDRHRPDDSSSEQRVRKGPVPSKISSFRYLTNLRLGRNNFTGELPFGISSLTKLTTLSVEKNPLLHGNITRITSSLSKLDYLNITMTSMLT